MPEATILSRDAFYIDDLISPAQCEQWIAWAEDRGFEGAGFNGREQNMKVLAARNNDRIIEDNNERAELLWELARPHIPGDFVTLQMMRRHAIGAHRLVGLNERFRWYRYKPGQRFTPHVDKAFVRGDGEVSLFTVLLYLNHVEGGGETRLELSKRESVKIAPAPGRLLCFEHHLMHEGCSVERGVKYALRSDLMYTKER